MCYPLTLVTGDSTSAYGTRTRAPALRGPCPNRLDERAKLLILRCLRLNLFDLSGSLFSVFTVFRRLKTPFSRYRVTLRSLLSRLIFGKLPVCLAPVRPYSKFDIPQSLIAITTGGSSALKTASESNIVTRLNQMLKLPLTITTPK